MNIELKDRKAIVTGSTAGIGRAAAWCSGCRWVEAGFGHLLTVAADGLLTLTATKQSFATATGAGS